MTEYISPRFEARAVMRATISEMVRSIGGDRRGSIAILTALCLPLALLLVGGVIDYSQVSNQRQRLQDSADKSALAAARELGLSDAKSENVAAVVESVVLSTMTANGRGHAKPDLETSVSAELSEVAVRARQKTSPYFGGGFGFVPLELEVKAVARIVGKPNICLLALESSEPGALYLVKSSRLTGNNCSVFSNSSASNGLVVKDSAILTATTVCSSGGIDQTGTISPAGLMDCPSFEDPLASRSEPVMGTCDYQNTKLANVTVTLRPGIYCGGISIAGTSDIRLEPGIYAIKTGVLEMKDQAKLTGDDVTLFLGPTTWFFLAPDTTVSLSASKSGPLAGLLLFGSREQSKIITHTILSKNAQRFVGTVYLPRNSFIVDGDSSVGGASAYTAIVARRVVLLNGPHLVLNTNYDQTDVPVPAGIRGADQAVTLVK